MGAPEETELTFPNLKALNKATHYVTISQTDRYTHPILDSHFHFAFGLGNHKLLAHFQPLPLILAGLDLPWVQVAAIGVIPLLFLLAGREREA